MRRDNAIAAAVVLVLAALVAGVIGGVVSLRNVVIVVAFMAVLGWVRGDPPPAGSGRAIARSRHWLAVAVAAGLLAAHGTPYFWIPLALLAVAVVFAYVTQRA